MIRLFSICVLLSINAVATAQDVDMKPKMIMGDTANTAWLQGEARRVRTNCESLKTKGHELMKTYKPYVERTKKNCPGAYVEAKAAYDMAKRAVKYGEKGIKLSHRAEKTRKMKKAQRWIKQVEAIIISGSKYLRESEDRKKEVEFELKGC
ncbi:MAG: hypothetical protein NZ529_08335 [Cytophagaceae bacterium]|nr:hypothetical protein [Cytophagaceae bacterium]MDW8456791.1 hypothetical protein [Cytophagaceae bacterium]